MEAVCSICLTEVRLVIRDDTHAYEISSFDRVIDVDQVQSLLFRIHAGDSPEKYESVDFEIKKYIWIDNAGRLL